MAQVINLVTGVILLERWRWGSHSLELTAKTQRQKMARAAKAARQKRK